MHLNIYGDLAAKLTSTWISTSEAELPHCRQVVDALIAALCAAAAHGATSAWQPACTALGREGGVLAGRKYPGDRVQFAGDQLLALLRALRPAPLVGGAARLQLGAEGQQAVEAGLDLCLVIAEAEDSSKGCTTWQVRRCGPAALC